MFLVVKSCVKYKNKTFDELINSFTNLETTNLGFFDQLLLQNGFICQDDFFKFAIQLFHQIE